MKKIANFIFFVTLFITLSGSQKAFSASAESITLTEAIKKGVVKISIIAADRDTLRPFSSYYGACLKLKMISSSSQTMSIKIENGYFLQPADSNDQRMIITKEELISLSPKQKKSLNLYAMCTQMHHSSPDELSQYALASKSEGSLFDLIQLIDKNNYQSGAAQHAIWTLTDGSDISSIYSDNEKELTDLQGFISKITGKSIPRSRNPLNYSSGSVNGAISWENKTAQTLTFYIRSENGNKEVTFFEKQNFIKPALNTLNWKFSFKGFPKGVYYVVLEDLKGTEIAIRPFIVN